MLHRTVSRTDVEFYVNVKPAHIETQSWKYLGLAVRVGREEISFCCWTKTQGPNATNTNTDPGIPSELRVKDNLAVY